jgi:ATP-dependent Zn protease
MSAELDPRSIAIHEAGHAVVAHRLGERVIEMLISESGGATRLRPLTASMRRARIERVATVFLAGDIALAIYQGLTSLRFASSGEILGDMTRATALVGRIHGITEPEVTELLKDMAERAGKVLNSRENWALVERLTDELLTKRSLTGREVAAIVPLSKSG